MNRKVTECTHLLEDLSYYCLKKIAVVVRVAKDIPKIYTSLSIRILTCMRRALSLPLVILKCLLCFAFVVVAAVERSTINTKVNERKIFEAHFLQQKF